MYSERYNDHGAGSKLSVLYFVSVVYVYVIDCYGNTECLFHLYSTLL